MKCYRFAPAILMHLLFWSAMSLSPALAECYPPPHYHGDFGVCCGTPEACLTGCPEHEVMVCFPGPPPNGIDCFCLPENTSPPPLCARQFIVNFELLPKDDALDVLNNYSFIFAYIPQPYDPAEYPRFESEVRIPLGRSLRITYKADIPSQVEGSCPKERTIKVAGEYILSNPIIDPPLQPFRPNYALFPNTPVVTVGGSPTDLAGTTFVPIHLGTATLDFNSHDTTIPDLRLNIKVQPPEFLGIRSIHARDDAALHEYIISVAHNYGIPPQYIKGWINKETDAPVANDLFNPFTYRYEPNYQRLYVNNASATWRSAFASLGLQEPPPGFPADGGELTLPASDPIVNARNRFNICTANCQAISLPARTLRPIQFSDLGTSITAWEISDNNRAYNLIYGSNQSNWINPAWRQTTAPQYSFIAQTAISSSYGLVNMMVPTYKEELIHHGLSTWSSPLPNPYELYDQPASIAAERSSLLMSIFRLNRLRIADGIALPLTSVQRFEQGWRDIFQEHNRYEGGYGAGVLTRSQRFLPKPARCVIPNSEACSS